jgi:predicted acyl esterase
MRSQNWETSQRQYDVTVERDVTITVGDGTTLAGDLFRPDTDERVPAIVSASPYPKEDQSAQMKPKAIGPQLAWVEAGNPYFFARRGYAHIILNVRGTGKSEGEFRNLDEREARDVVEAIEWIADRDWCDGSVGMYGVSYFGMIQLKVAEQDPDALDAIFAPWAQSDPYRDMYYHGGILSHEFAEEWGEHIDNPRCYSWSTAHMGEEAFAEAREAALQDEEIYASESLVDALENPTEHTNPLLADVIVNDHDGEYFAERRVDFEDTNVPAYLGAGWGHYGIHLSAAFRNWDNWAGPKKLLIGPDVYLDRPVYQLGNEALRWFDYWLKDVDTGIMDEPPISLFVMGTGEWQDAEEWPLPETKWTEFYLHEDDLLLDRDHWPNEGQSTFEEGPYRHEELSFLTPKMVERTQILGPSLLTLYASTTDTEALFFAELFKHDTDGNETLLTRGWLRGSHRAVDADRSEPWKVHHPHDERDLLEPNEVYEFQINLVETGVELDVGERLGVRISGADVGGGWGENEGSETVWKEGVATGHLYRQHQHRTTVYHNDEYPSNLLISITKGKKIGLYYSGG